MSSKPFTYTDDLPVKAKVTVEDLDKRLDGVEDKISDLMETMAQLIAIARKDHPDLVTDWPEEESQ